MNHVTLLEHHGRQGPYNQDPHRIPPSGVASWLCVPLVAMMLAGCLGAAEVCAPEECPACDPEECSIACLEEPSPLGICIEDACWCVDDQDGGVRRP